MTQTTKKPTAKQTLKAFSETCWQHHGNLTGSKRREFSQSIFMTADEARHIAEAIDLVLK